MSILKIGHSYGGWPRLWHLTILVYYTLGSENWKILGGRLPQNRVFFKTGRGGVDFFAKKYRTHLRWNPYRYWQYASLRLSMPCKQKWYAWFIIITITCSAAQNATRNLWINYILLWKNEIYSGKHLEKSWKNDPERLCEPCYSCTVCDYSWKQKGNLNTHLILHSAG